MGFEELASKTKKSKTRRLVVVGAHETTLLEAVVRAVKDGIAVPVLLGDSNEITRIADAEGIDLKGCDVEDIPDARDAAEAAMEMVRAGTVEAVMKGKITTADLMRVALNGGLRRENRLVNHVTVFEHPRLGAGKLMMLTDAGLITFPTLEQRVGIINNGVEVMRRLGVPEPRVAVLSLTEEVDEKVPSSVHAAKLKAMNIPGGELEGAGIIDGPFDLFAAVDTENAKTKGIESDVAGRADILHCPNAVAGNLFSKGIIYFAEQSRTGGCVVGGTVPVILLSRASSADDKYCSILLGLSCAPGLSLEAGMPPIA
ncbi:MAG: phosphate butyryltransferase [Deltaproteobacteria bacterium]|nr:phosphate butyryltransferase [Deltaproteobacteria bacterium]